jgi:hypothetical protein
VTPGSGGGSRGRGGSTGSGGSSRSGGGTPGSGGSTSSGAPGGLRGISRRIGTEVRRALRDRQDPPADRALRKRIVADGGRLDPAHPSPAVWQAWRDTALQSSADSAAAVAEVARCGLPPHPDDPKNWDLLVALGETLERCQPGDRVLEAGAPGYSRYLTWLWMYGFRKLHGIDLVYESEVRHGSIQYEPMDLTKTRFRDGEFAAVACLSVIEHGVDPRAYVREMARILRPGGVLVTSTDYWCAPLDVAGKEAYGGPVKVFGPDGIAELVALAAEVGLEPERKFDPSCEEAVVHWKRVDLDYTFANVVLVRR